MRLVVAAPLLLTACVHASPPVRSAQEDAIRAQVATLERSSNARDAVANAAVFSETGDLILPGAPRQVGRAAIRAMWERIWRGGDPSRRLTIAVDLIRFPTPDVAIVEVKTSTSGAQAHHDRATYVFVQRGGRWWLEALRVMPPQEGQRNAHSS